MLKLLRKYNKIALVIFGSVLMVAFLAPQAIQQIGQGAQNRKVADIGDGESISFRDAARSNAEYQVIRRGSPGVVGQLGLGIGEADHWLLFSHEAQRAGLVGEETDGLLFLDSAASLTARTAVAADLMRLSGLPFSTVLRFMDMPQYQQQAAELEQQLRASAPTVVESGIGGLNRREAAEGLAKASGAFRFVAMHAFGGVPSEQRLLQFARDNNDAAIADTLFIPGVLAEADGALPEPTEDELAAHFEAYRDISRFDLPEDAEFPFGYRQPQRLKLSWIVLPRSVFEDAASVDPVAVRRGWIERGGEAFGAFDEQRSAIETELREQAADRLMNEAQRIIRTAMLGEIRSLSMDELYREVPEGWLTPRFDDVAQQVADELNAEHGLSLDPMPVVTREDAWATRGDMLQLPGIGSARLQVGGLDIPFPDAALRVRELAGDNSSMPIQAGIPFLDAYASNSNGDRFFFTVLDARDESAPDSIDEVREQVQNDLTLQRRFEALRQQETALTAMLLTSGIEGLRQDVLNRLIIANQVEAAEALRVGERTRVSRLSANGVGMNPAINTEVVRDAVADMARTIDHTRPVESLTDAETTLLIPVPAQGGYAAVRIRAVDPLTLESFQRDADAYVRQFQQFEYGGALNETGGVSPFSFEAMSERLGFSRVDEDR